MKITYATNYDDWEGIYVDGKLKMQGHHLRVHEVLELFSDFSTYEEIDAGEYLAEVGHLPYTVEELFDENA